MNDTKGIAIRLDKELYNKIESHEMSRNSLVQEAIVQFLDNNAKDDDLKNEDSISDEVYSEVYNTLYNSEMLPLKQKIQSQEKIINLLEKQLNEVRGDKLFLQNQLQVQTALMESNMPLLACIKRKLSKSSN